MLFNTAKYKCVHYGHNNMHYDLALGMTITYTLEVTEQCVKVSNKANAVLGMINRAIKYKTKEVVVQLYKSLVRPHLDYCIQA